MVEQEATAESDESAGPKVRVDYRVFAIEVEGGESDSLADVNDVVNNRLAEAKTDIEDLKRTDFELDDEYEVERPTARGPGGMHQ